MLFEIEHDTSAKSHLSGISKTIVTSAIIFENITMHILQEQL